jgi:hypothetical protein
MVEKYKTARKISQFYFKTKIVSETNASDTIFCSFINNIIYIELSTDVIAFYISQLLIATSQQLISYFFGGTGARMIVILFPSSLGSISTLP